MCSVCPRRFREGNHREILVSDVVSLSTSDVHCQSPGRSNTKENIFQFNFNVIEMGSWINQKWNGKFQDCGGGRSETILCNVRRAFTGVSSSSKAITKREKKNFILATFFFLFMAWKSQHSLGSITKRMLINFSKSFLKLFVQTKTSAKSFFSQLFMLDSTPWIILSERQTQQALELFCVEFNCFSEQSQHRRQIDGTKVMPARRAS